MFELKFKTDGEAFEDGWYEVARILHEIAGDIATNGKTSGVIRDVNGNHSGSWNYNKLGAKL